MTIFYHGTTASNAIQIARAGAIWSPYMQKMHWLKSIKEKNNHIYERLSANGNLSIDIIALELAKVGFAEREVEDRVKCVALSLKPDYKYDIIIGTELNHPPQDNLFIPKEVQLSNVRELYYKNSAQAIRAAFAKYSPRFIQF